MRSCLSSSSTMRSRSTSTRRRGTRGRERRRRRAKSLNQRRLSSKSDPTCVRFSHRKVSKKKLSLIFSTGTEAPAASGNAARHRGEASWYFLYQSQHRVRRGGSVKVIKYCQGGIWPIPFQFWEAAVTCHLRLLRPQLVQFRLRREEDGQGWEPLGKVSYFRNSWLGVKLAGAE